MGTIVEENPIAASVRLVKRLVKWCRVKGVSYICLGTLKCLLGGCIEDIKRKGFIEREC